MSLKSSLRSLMPRLILLPLALNQLHKAKMFGARCSKDFEFTKVLVEPHYGIAIIQLSVFCLRSDVDTSHARGFEQDFFLWPKGYEYAPENYQLRKDRIFLGCSSNFDPMEHMVRINDSQFVGSNQNTPSLGIQVVDSKHQTSSSLWKAVTAQTVVDETATSAALETSRIFKCCFPKLCKHADNRTGLLD